MFVKRFGRIEKDQSAHDEKSQREEIAVRDPVRFRVFTRITFWLLLIAIAVYAGVLAYAWFAFPPSERATIIFAPTEPERFAPGQIPPQIIVVDFSKAVARNAGRTAIPESELPYPREMIHGAITSAPQWSRDFASPGGPRAYHALFLELANFVPAENRPTPEVLWERQSGVAPFQWTV